MRAFFTAICIGLEGCDRMTPNTGLGNFERKTKLGVHTQSEFRIEGVVMDTVVESKATLKTPAYAAKLA